MFIMHHHRYYHSKTFYLFTFIIYTIFVLFQITRSVSNISAMRCKHDSSATAAQSEVASAELSCYGVFRKLETGDDDVGRAGDGSCFEGGGERHRRRVIAGRLSPSRLPVSPSSTVFSPQEPAFVYVTAAAAAVDADDEVYAVDGDFDQRTYSVYDCDDYAANGSCQYAATTVTSSTATTNTTASCAVGRCSRDEDLLSDFGAVAWDDYDCPATAAVVGITTADLRVVGGAAVPFSHTPMGSTTKLVGIDANNDDTPNVSSAFCFCFPKQLCGAVDPT